MRDCEQEKAAANRIFRDETESVLIFTSTANFQALYHFLRARGNFCKIAVPENRLGSDKIKSIQRFCEANHVDIRTHPRDPAALEHFHEWIREGGMTFALSWNYSQILKKETLSLFPKGIWNMHGGKIPEYRGGNVLQWAIANGETEAGVAWHLMDEKVDHGQILKQGTVPILESDTAIEVFEKLSGKGFELFCQLWEEAGAEGITPYGVDLTAGHYWRARTPLDGIIRPEMTVREIQNLLRAQCPPWPAPIVVKQGVVFRVHGIARCQGECVMEYETKEGRIFLNVSKETDSRLIQNVLERVPPL
ncbi:methionyl-tRNA formyltransferase [uncultured Oscillibacter sp.]|uniref:methionyl-tRNA formyltransferase n=1 Tax=uncultured Oscillibacter sp. TaxID=876091 RepID=UPI0026E26C52|nr:formyltransferase family protein [uncultured Oscillibacter sp.]